jgi:glycosyltransferase involved in cell wall biosynthesis
VTLDGSKICVLVSQLGYGGAERQTTVLLEGLARWYGLRPLVCCMSANLEPFGERIRRIGCELIHWERSKSYEFRRVLFLRRLIQEREIRLVHAVHYQAMAYAWLATLGMKDVGLVPAVRATVHDPNVRKRAFYRLALPQCRVIVSNSVTGGQWLRQFYGVKKERISLVPNGLDGKLLKASPDRTSVRRRLSIPEEAPVVAFVGKTNSHKGLPLLVRLFGRVLQARPDAHLILMGKGLDSHWVHEHFGAEPRVHGLGTRDDIYDLVGSADVLALTSPTEGFPNCVLEAMLLGVPPVATKVGECPFLIENGEDGFLYDYDDEAEGARLVLRVIEDDDLRAAMADRARNKILRRYGTKAMVDATVQAYRRVLGQGMDLPAAVPQSL